MKNQNVYLQTQQPPFAYPNKPENNHQIQNEAPEAEYGGALADCFKCSKINFQQFIGFYGGSKRSYKSP